MLKYISNTAHYKDVLSRVQSVKNMLWIGTADIKDLYIEVGKEKKPFLALIAQLIRRGVEVRLIHAKEPGPNFVRILTSTQCCMIVWSECFVPVFISKCLSLMLKRCISAVRILQVQVSK